MKTVGRMVVFATLTLALGCASEATQDELVAGQRAAHQALGFILGDDARAPADPALHAQLLELRDAIRGETTSMRNAGLEQVLGLQAVLYEVHGASRSHGDVSVLVDAIGARLSAQTPWAGEFFAVDRGTVDVGGKRYAVRGLDPEAAVLDESLGTTAGASAAAHGENSGEPTTAFRFPSKYIAAAGRDAWIGRPCVVGTVPVPVDGLITTFVIRASSSALACL